MRLNCFSLLFLLYIYYLIIIFFFLINNCSKRKYNYLLFKPIIKTICLQSFFFAIKRQKYVSKIKAMKKKTISNKSNKSAHRETTTRR